MTKAKITRSNGYSCAPDGHTVVTLPFGAIVTGRVAEWALSDNSASRMFDPVEERAVMAVDEAKQAPKKRGRPKKVRE